jgi:NAD(P)-dependent dehydrogenase (short-subunit alcohol dehydrogenase family)
MTFLGSNVLITGASSGLGLAVSKRFAQLGANTILLCRTEEAGESAVGEIKKEEPDAKVRSMTCDLASMASIDRFVADFKTEYAGLDLLFNNAAVMKRERTVTEDGFEMMFQVNYLGPFILMTALLEQLRGSQIHLVLNNALPSEKLRLDFDDLQFSKHYRMYNSFFQTKLCLLLASLELARRPESNGVSINMVVPGRPFKSALVREVPPPIGWLKNLFSAKVEEAAADILYVAQSDEARARTGQAFKKGQPVALAPYWQDANIRQRLWTETETMLEKSKSR